MPSPQCPFEGIDLTGDSEATASETSDDDDLRRAIALSLQAVQEHSEPVAATAAHEVTKSTSANGFLGLDRRQMEQERLARLKRKRNEPAAPPLPNRETKSSSIEPSVNQPTPPERPAGFPPVNKPIAASTSSSQRSTFTTTGSLITSKFRFAEGAVKKTWCFGLPRNGSDIKLEEILDRPNLESAVLSSFIWDFDWLFRKLDTNRSKFLLVMQGKDATQRSMVQADFDGIPNVRICFPPMDANVNCMHSKLMLLFYPTHLRVVVPSANLVPFDWGENNGVMENIVFVIDLPKVEKLVESTERPAFMRSLIQFLRAQRMPDDIVIRLGDFDFSRTSDFALVHTIGGTHMGQAWRTTGHCGLGTAIASMGMQTTCPISVDYVTSSVGSLDGPFLRSIYLAAQGDDGLSEYTLRTAKKFPAKCEADEATPRKVQSTTGAEWKDRLRVYFPSEKTVKASKGGPRSAGTICFQERWWNGSKFPRENMRDCVSEREGVLMHNKMLFVRFCKPIPLSSEQQALGYAYVGSANLSESAWGRLVKDKTTGLPKLTCRNWEIGVVVPITVAAASTLSSLPSSQDQESAFPALDEFRTRVPVPMQQPAKSFGGDSNPWFFTN